MPTISGSLNLVTDRPVDSISEVWVRARETRGQGDGLVVGVNDRVPVTDGAIEFTALPGAAVLVLVQNGMPLETLPMVVGDAAQQSLRLVVQAGEAAGEIDRRAIEQFAAEIAANTVRAEQYRTEAASSASAASASQSAAATSASKTKTSETKAKTSETNAKTSETNAASSADAAESQQETALAHLNNAVTEAGKAADSAAAAKTSETNAASSASASASSASSSQTQADNSAASATQAAAARDAAKTSETAAASSAAAAKTSETNSKQSETNAGDYAAVATTAATEAVDAMERATEIAGGDFATHEYVDSAVANVPRVDTTVGTRAFVGDQMIYGDTGWRDISDTILVEATEARLLIRRLGNIVYYTADDLRLVNDVPTGVGIVAIPAGFRPLRTFRVGTGATYELNAAVYSSGGGMELHTREGVVAGRRRFYLNWVTDNPWPTSLPGLPA